MKNQFNLTVPLEWSQREDGRYITGVAAGTSVDKENMRLSPTAIQYMAASINTSGALPFFDTHARNSILGGEIGTVTKAWFDDDYNMGVEVKLEDDNIVADQLWKNLTVKQKKYGMSIGGSGLNYTVEKSDGKNIMVFDRVDLDEISVTTKPMWSPSFGTVLCKAVEEAAPEGDTTPMKVTPEQPEAQAEATPVEKSEEQTAEATSVAPTIDENESVVSVEKAVSTDTAKEAKTLARIVEAHLKQDALLRELGLLSTSSENEEATSEEAPVEKAEDDATSGRFAALEKAIAELAETVTKRLDQIPVTPQPGVLVQKSDVEEFRAQVAEMSPMERIRLGLALAHGEEYKI
jgi:hypothetical protein